MKLKVSVNKSMKMYFKEKNLTPPHQRTPKSLPWVEGLVNETGGMVVSS
jgi:hypothetical protein